MSQRGFALLEDPLLNKGSAFSIAERDAFGLHGLLPPAVCDLDQQLSRTLANYDRQGSDLDRFLDLAALHDRNETLFYRVLQERLEELLPIIYTPTVGEACQRFSHLYRRPRGIYLTPADAGRVANIFEALPASREVRVIVVTDNERILGLGDLGAGGMGIPVGKLAIYTAAGGIAPEGCLPVSLDVGTNNADLLSDPLYLGCRRERLRGPAYDALVEEFVVTATRRWPRVLIQWEDFGNQNAFRLLERYRERVLSFNDDIQGTGAVALAGILAALRARGERMSDQRVVFLGAGEAANGIADRIVDAMVAEGTSEEVAKRQLWMTDRLGLVVGGRGNLSPEKMRWGRSAVEAEAFGMGEGVPSLLQVVRHVKPRILVGTSGTPGTFTEEVIRSMAAGTEQPIIMPLSNPTSKAECSPHLAYTWTEGRCLVATGSPFPAVKHGGRSYRIGQANNAFIFPGIGLGALVVEARQITDSMFREAARALAALVTPQDLAEGSLYPAVARLREAGQAVAVAVAREAIRSGVAGVPLREDEVAERVAAAMWSPRYRPYRAS